MKLNGASPRRAPRGFLPYVSLAVSGFVLLPLMAAQTQVINTSGQSYYLTAKPLLDYPLPDLLKAAPELQGLEPAKDQNELPSLLDRIGRVTQDLLEGMPNVVSHEEVTQQRLGVSGKVEAHRRLEFEYMILPHMHGTTLSLDEYRATPSGTPVDTEDMGIRFMLTRGFAGAWMHFLPPVLAAARFRYLGQETNNGLRCHIVAFAQKPGYATIVGWVSHGGGMVCVLYQGIAWIDEVSLRIVRLRTDLLAPRPDIGLERQTNELYLGETRLPQHASLLWLPQQVVVTADSGKQHFRNVHRYSDYRLFKVESKILPVPPDEPATKKPD